MTTFSVQIGRSPVRHLPSSSEVPVLSHPSVQNGNQRIVMQFLLDKWRWIVQNELVTAGLLLATALGTWGFVSIADEVLEGEAHAFDQKILLSMRTTGDPSNPVGPIWFEEMARDVTALGSVTALTIFTATMAAYLYFAKQHWIALFLVVAILSGAAISTVMKSGFDRPRPDLVSHGTRVYTRSFPSGHSAMSSLVYLTLGAVMARAEPSRKTKALLLIVPVFLLVIIGASRVYLGVHWPTDVVAGWAFGLSWAAASWLVFRTLERRYHLPVISHTDDGNPSASESPSQPADSI